MDPVMLVLACGLAARSTLLVTLGVQPDCKGPAHIKDSVAVDRWSSEINEAAQRFGVPARWVRAVMQAESNGKPSTTSPAGAMGLMQIMPETWAELRSRYGEPRKRSRTR